MLVQVGLACTLTVMLICIYIFRSRRPVAPDVRDAAMQTLNNPSDHLRSFSLPYINTQGGRRVHHQSLSQPLNQPKVGTMSHGNVSSDAGKL